LIWPDHALIGALGLGFPLAGLWFKRRLVRAKPHERPHLRLRFYLANGIALWLFVLAAISIWVATARSWFALGLMFMCTVHTWSLLFAFVVILVLSLRQYAQLSREPKRLIIVGGVLDRPRWLPSRPGEQASYLFFSSSAGICEEVLYRAYLFWYLHHWLPVLAAGALSAVVFGTRHPYQSFREMGRSTGVGLALFLIYYVGAVYASAAFHFLFNVQSARLIFAAIRVEEENPGLVEQMAAEERRAS
jgi:uncharacterized protein